MNEAMKPIYVLFGSQTGNSESIAGEVYDRLTKDGYVSTCLPLNDVAKKDLRNEARALVVVCATTGNGDCPDNADKFWRLIKKRSAPKDLFEDVPFSVLGLGDTNYDKFCHMGKSVDKRLKDLGGVRLIELQCADEATGLEEVVETWKSKLFSCLEALRSDQTLKDNGCAQSSEKVQPAADCTTDQVNSVDKTIILNGTAGVKDICSYLGTSMSELCVTPESSQLPKRRKQSPSNIEILGEVKGKAHQLSEKDVIECNGEYSVSNPFKASVLDASWLTRKPDYDNASNDSAHDAWGEDHSVIKLELSTRGSNIHYQPGDYVSIIAPNPPSLVNYIMERIRVGYQKFAQYSTVITLDTVFRKGNEVLDFRELLQYRLDLVGVPRRATVLSLSEYCSDESEASVMKWLCSKGDLGKRLWKNFVEAQCLNVVELLQFFPSCIPPPEVLILNLAPLTPRTYSISSSPLAHPDSIVIAFSIVRFRCGIALWGTDGVDAQDISKFCIKRSGLCTTFLENILQPFLCSESPRDIHSLTLRILWRPSISFRLPGNVASPLILIGPGTGVAPFIGFLEHRAFGEKERCQSGEDTTQGLWRGCFELDEGCKLPNEGNAINNYIQCVDHGQIYLFYGCRNEDDWIFKENMQDFVDEGVLTALEVAFSRQTTEKVYVTHKLLAWGNRIADLILRCNAHVYICGDGNNMAKDVLATLARILCESEGVAEEYAQEVLDDMRSRRRLMMDVWS